MCTDIAGAWTCRACLRKGKDRPPKFTEAQQSVYRQFGLQWAAPLLQRTIIAWQDDEVRLCAAWLALISPHVILSVISPAASDYCQPDVQAQLWIQKAGQMQLLHAWLASDWYL